MREQSHHAQHIDTHAGQRSQADMERDMQLLVQRYEAGKAKIRRVGQSLLQSVGIDKPRD